MHADDWVVLLCAAADKETGLGEENERAAEGRRVAAVLGVPAWKADRAGGSALGGYEGGLRGGSGEGWVRKGVEGGAEENTCAGREGSLEPVEKDRAIIAEDVNMQNISNTVASRTDQT